MIKSKLFVIIAVSVILLFESSPVFAQLQAPTGGKIKLGPVEIHPSIGLMETYSDNIYVSYDDKAKESDYITTLSPGIQFLLPLKRHSFQVGYKSDINLYSDNDEINYTNHLFGGGLSLNFLGGLIFTLSDYYSIATVPRKWKERAGVSESEDPYRGQEHNVEVVEAITIKDAVEHFTGHEIHRSEPP
ncbi:MAG: outer membrane beta-barrel protein, partial [Desulfosporosinus sp.]|nr:outer membrane beta-barrel protein [Desulfosporosinus sp.]